MVLLPLTEQDIILLTTNTDLNNVAANTRLMPDKFINMEGNNVTDEFKYYLQPLLGEDMPQASMLRAPRAKKILCSKDN